MPTTRISFTGIAATSTHQCFGTQKSADGQRVPSRHILHPEGCEASLPVPLLAEHDKNRIVGEVTRIIRRPERLHVIGYIEADGTPETRRLLERIRAGELGLSCGYDILEERGMFDVVRWRLDEVSITKRPANPRTSIALGDAEPAPATKADTVRRAYSLLTIKRADEDSRTITGLATSVSVDHMGDIVEPAGAEFKLPLPLLMHHNPTQPIGHVTRARATAAGIEVEAKILKTDQAGPVKDRLDGAWQDIRLGLVRGLSIGFKPLEVSRLKDGGLRFIRWAWLELSAVTIAANQDATITAVKSAAVAPAPRERLDPDLDALLTGLRKATGIKGERLGRGLAELFNIFAKPMLERMKALERKAMRFSGVHVDGQAYTPGAVVQRSGTIWVCIEPTTERPGASQDWRMLQKTK